MGLDLGVYAIVKPSNLGSSVGISKVRERLSGIKAVLGSATGTLGTGEIILLYNDAEPR